MAGPITGMKWSWQIPTCALEDLFLKLQKLGIEIINKVGLVEKKDGEQHFIRFKENGYKWLKEDYEHEGFQSVFCERLFMTRAELIFNILSEFECQKVLPNLLYDDNFKSRALSVASFGCGPGNDLAGFETYFTNLKKCRLKLLEEKKVSVSQSDYSLTLKCIEETKIQSITGYDSAEGWSRYLDVLGYSFKHQVIDYHYLNEMLQVDIVILSYFAHNALFSVPIDVMDVSIQQNIHHRADGEEPFLLQDCIRNWDILMKKTKMIIVVDTKACVKPLFRLLRARGFGSVVGQKDSHGREVAAHVWTDKDLWK